MSISHKKFLWSLVVLCVASVFSVRAETTKEEDFTEEFVENLNLKSMVEYYSTQVRKEFEAKADNNNGRLPKSFQDGVQKAAAVYFTKETILEYAEYYLKHQVNDADAKKMRSWFETDLGRKIHTVEYNHLVPALEKYLGERVIPANEAEDKKSDPERYAQLQELDHAFGLTSRFVKISVALPSIFGRTMHSAFSSRSASLGRPNHYQVFNKIEPRVHKAMEEAYQSLHNGELNQYIAFSKSPTGRRMFALSHRAIEYGISTAIQYFQDEIAHLSLKGGNVAMENGDNGFTEVTDP